MFIFRTKITYTKYNEDDLLLHKGKKIKIYYIFSSSYTTKMLLHTDLFIYYVSYMNIMKPKVKNIRNQGKLVKVGSIMQISITRRAINEKTKHASSP